MIGSYKRSREPAIGLGEDAGEALAIRLAGPADERALARLAALDGAPPLDGPVVVADVGGELRAARSLADGRTIADPFRRTLGLLALLELRARQLAQPARAQVQARAGARQPQYG